MRDARVLCTTSVRTRSHAGRAGRFALYGQFEPLAFAVVVGCTAVFFGGTIFMYDPAKGLWRGRKGGAA